MQEDLFRELWITKKPDAVSDGLRKDCRTCDESMKDLQDWCMGKIKSDRKQKSRKSACNPGDIFHYRTCALDSELTNNVVRKFVMAMFEKGLSDTGFCSS